MWFRFVDGGSQEDDRATAAEMAMYSNEAATSSASLPDQTTATALDVVLQPGHGHSRSLDDATPITDILSIIENRQEIDADTLEGILDGQGSNYTIADLFPPTLNNTGG